MRQNIISQVTTTNIYIVSVQFICTKYHPTLVFISLFAIFHIDNLALFFTGLYWSIYKYVCYDIYVLNVHLCLCIYQWSNNLGGASNHISNCFLECWGSSFVAKTSLFPWWCVLIYPYHTSSRKFFIIMFAVLRNDNCMLYILCSSDCKCYWWYYY